MYVIYNTHLLKNIHNTDCKFHFIAKNFFSINFTFFSTCFYYALNILTTLYRIGSWNATRTYPVQCSHDMKARLSGVKTIHRWTIRIFTGQGRFLRIRVFWQTFHLRHIKESPAVFFFNFQKRVAKIPPPPPSSLLIVSMTRHQIDILMHPKNNS